jgi:large subunit ribosomal protein L10
MDRSQKEIAVKELAEIFDGAGSVVMTAYSGMTVAEMTELRAKLREHGATIRVVKNRLAKIAMKGKSFEAAAEKFTGPVAIAWADDMISAPKVTVDYAKDSKVFDIIGGFMGEEVLDVSGIDTLSKLPSREELISMSAQLLLAPVTSIASALTSQAGNIAGNIATIEEKAAA